MNLHRLESIGGGGLVQSRACSGFSEWQDTCAEREWQCSHLSEHRVDVKPRGLGNTVRVLKSLKQGEWAWDCRGHGKQMHFHYTDTYACQVTLSDWF